MAEPAFPPAQEPRQKEPRRNRAKGSGPTVRGGRQTTVPDPEFSRSPLDASEVPKARTLFDPNGPIPHKTPMESSSKRLEAVSATNPRVATTAAPSVSKITPTTPKPRNRKKGNNRPGSSEQANTSQITRVNSMPNKESTLGTREGGRTFILTNQAPHTQGPHNQAQSQPQAVFMPLPQDESVPEGHPDLAMVRQPETRPISADQLLSEVKGIYAGLVMVEAKCLEVDGRQAAQAKALEAEGLDPPPLTNEQWQALIALHRTLLHEHHDFFLASQHPSASPALRRLAAKYAMPARMWRHGIHSFLELLRHRLPLSLEHMLSFIYLAYSIMALLYETVPAFEETWIECLGDLGRYRMAIEDDDFRDREVWTVVARTWYSKAADKKPTTGRLYHHIAILARPNPLQQLFYYCKSLTVTIPFAAARESILSLFDPVLGSKVANRPQTVDGCLVALHAIWFTHIGLDRFDGILEQYIPMLDAHISSHKEKWNVQGCLIAVCNIAALYQYNSDHSKLRQAWKEGRATIKEEGEAKSEVTTEKTTTSEYEGVLPPLPRGASSEHVTPLALIAKSKIQSEGYKSKVTPIEEAANEASWVPLEYAIKLAFQTLKVVLDVDDPCILPHIHAWLVFLFHNKDSIPAMRLLERDFPWEQLTVLLNYLIESEGSDPDPSDIDFERDEFPVRQHRPLPEDWTLRGLEWVQDYFPEKWIESAKVDDEERLLELPSFHAIRKERILWLAYKVAMAGDWMVYNSRSGKFSVHSGVLERIEEQKRDILRRQERNSVYIKKEESDTEMDSAGAAKVNIGEGFENVEVPDAVKSLLDMRVKLETQLESGKPSESETKPSPELISRTPPRDALRSNYTVLVVDTNFLLKSPELFKLTLANNDWSMVIPNTALTELSGLINSSGPVASEARDALAAIRAAITAKKDLKIITAKGNDMTRQIFYKERLEEYKDDERNIDDIIIEIANQQGRIRAQAMRAGDKNMPLTVKPAALVTNDTNMRVKATANNVYAISGAELKDCLGPTASSKVTRTNKNQPNESPVVEASSSTHSTNQAKPSGNKRRQKRIAG
ncbi:hypothetical protein DFH27DRAFT_19132 [Peziza echinospora]|nr:hypothetical protein DFH27DRAFT_19132 [Peziza echinospora]